MRCGEFNLCTTEFRKKRWPDLRLACQDILSDIHIVILLFKYAFADNLVIKWKLFLVEATLLENQLLISMPNLVDSTFEKVVVYVCEHNEKGAVGLIVNRPTEFN